MLMSIVTLYDTLIDKVSSFSQLVKFREKWLSTLKKIIPSINQQIKTRSSFDKLFSKHRKKSHDLDNLPPRTNPLCRYLYHLRTNAKSPPSQFLNSSIPSSPFLTTPPPFNHLGTSIMNETYHRVWRGRFRIRGWEIDTRGFLRETRGWEKLVEMWKRA